MSTEHRIPVVGDAVIYCDPKGKDHNALVQIVWGGPTPAINVCFVSDDENRKDNYGRQIMHETSVSAVSYAGAHGRYWRWPEEARRDYEQPQSV